ncbi:MAG TPA: zf-HC2 domain-containing protein [Polyangiaceae bacterium]|nr:zf-HC2 domain-containing protein [Polyangiaceae bacterium]
MKSCRSFAPLLEPFSDGELGPEKMLEVEQHLLECRLCVERVRFGEAMRRSLRRRVRETAPVSDAFRARVVEAVAAAREREWEHLRAARAERRSWLSFRTIVPMAAAAALTLVWAASAGGPERREQRRATSYAQVDPVRVDDLLEELVEHHVRGRSDFTELSLLPEAEREVGVPVRVPSLKNFGAQWEGASVVPVLNQRAASLRYRLGNHRVTVYVYDPSRVPIEKRLEQRLVGSEPVYVGVRRGYSIGATEHRGVGYALATDLTDAETAELVAAIY